MKIELNYKEHYSLINKSLNTDLSSYKNDDLYVISENPTSYESYINSLVSNSPIKLKDIYNEKKDFILSNTRIRNYESGDLTYYTSPTKIIITIPHESARDNLIRILGSVAFYAIGRRFAPRVKRAYAPMVSQQLSYLISKVSYRPIDTDQVLPEINRYVLAMLFSTHDIDQSELLDAMLNINIQYPNKRKFDEFKNEITKKDINFFFDKIAKLLGSDENALKQIIASKYEKEILLTFEDISHYFYILFISNAFRYKETVSVYTTKASDPNIKYWANKIVDYTASKFLQPV